jgi:hypothetical protein
MHCRCLGDAEYLDMICCNSIRGMQQAAQIHALDAMQRMCGFDFTGEVKQFTAQMPLDQHPAMTRYPAHAHITVADELSGSEDDMVSCIVRAAYLAVDGQPPEPHPAFDGVRPMQNKMSIDSRSDTAAERREIEIHPCAPSTRRCRLIATSYHPSLYRVYSHDAKSYAQHHPGFVPAILLSRV